MLHNLLLGAQYIIVFINYLKKLRVRETWRSRLLGLNEHPILPEFKAVCPKTWQIPYSDDFILVGKLIYLVLCDLAGRRTYVICATLCIIKVKNYLTW